MTDITICSVTAVTDSKARKAYNYFKQTDTTTYKEKKIMAAELTLKTFDEKVMKSKVPVLVDFFAEWCGPCTMLAPTINELANEANGRFEVYKVNVDKEPHLADKFGVSSIPTLVVIENGKVKTRSVGLKSKEAILAMLA